MSARELLPDAVIIGAPKAGTSALHVALAQHPQVYASPVKEPKYYSAGTLPHPPTGDLAIRTVGRNGSGVARTTRRFSRRLHRTRYAWRARPSIFTCRAPGAGSPRNCRR